MKTLRTPAAVVVPAALLIVALAALTGGWKWGPAARPRAVDFVFPESSAASEAVASLRSCATIEEAMLFKVMGVVRNRSTGPLRYPMAQASFLDEQGNVLDRSQGCVVPEVLESQHDGRFVLVTRPDPRIAAVAVALADPDGQPLSATYAPRDPAQGFVQP